MLNYVLQETAQEKLVYVGYSQGTMMGFAGFSTQPELADKVKLFIALAPVARVSNLQGELRPLSKFVYNEVFIVSHYMSIYVAAFTHITTVFSCV